MGMLMPMLPTLPMGMASLMPMLVSPLAPAVVLTQSLRDLMLPPRDMPPSMDTPDTTLARGLLVLKLMLMLSMLPSLMQPPSPMLMLEFPLDPALVLTPSPRVLMPPPRDMPPTSDTLLATMPASKLESFL